MNADSGRYVGRTVVRARARRLVAGRGQYTDDIPATRVLHAAFYRSPHPHALIKRIDLSAARAMQGVVLAVSGAEMAERCKPFAGVHRLFKGMKAPEQWPLAVGRTRWQGEPVFAIAAVTRALAEDALDLVEIEWEVLDGVGTPEKALTNEPLLHAELGDNVGYDTTIDVGDSAAVFADADIVIEDTFRFARNTGVCLEPRSIVATYDPTEDSLVVHQSHQCPSQQQAIYADLLGIPEHRVRVVCPDVGGAFGLKQQLYGDEIATCILAKLAGRSVKFVADRQESFASDIHAREHVVHARMAFDRDGRILGLQLDDLFAVGAFSQYPRSSVGEGSHVLRLTAAAYRVPAYRARMRMIYQNKPPVGHYRAVGHPIACTIGESLIDQGARALGLDPVAIRRINHVRDGSGTHQSHGGNSIERLTLDACLDRLLDEFDLPAFRTKQAEARQRGVLLGFGLANFVELTGTGAPYYGESGAPVTAQESCIVRLEPSGRVRCFSSATDQGQGTDTAIAQTVADGIGVALDDVEIFSGDSMICPPGGGAWASRGASSGVEAAVRAALGLRQEILRLAGLILQRTSDQLLLKDGKMCDAVSGVQLIGLNEIAAIAHYRQHLLPPGTQPELSVVRSFVPQNTTFLMTNGLQMSTLSVDPGLGEVRLLSHRVVHDSGTVINPQLLDEQIRGGVVQGLGAALFEELPYSEDGVLGAGTLADYLVPLATEMPDIQVSHVAIRDPSTSVGAKGAGEAGTAGASAAVLNAVNDAIAHLGAHLSELPITPQRMLCALTAARAAGAIDLASK